MVILTPVDNAPLHCGNEVAGLRAKHAVLLTAAQHQELARLIRVGKAPARKLIHARILLRADCGENGAGWTDRAISEALSVSLSTIQRVREAFATQGLEAALNRRIPETQRPRKVDARHESHLIALTHSEPPPGHDRWTLRLLAGKMVELGYVDSLSYETVRQILRNERGP